MTEALRRIGSEWTMVAQHATQVLIVVPPGAGVRGYIGFEAPSEGKRHFPVAGRRIIDGISVLHSVFLRTDVGEIDVSVSIVSVTDPVETHGQTPFNDDQPGNLQLKATAQPQVIDGGGADTDYDAIEAVTIDGGGADFDDENGLVIDGGAVDTDYTNLPVLDYGNAFGRVEE